MPKHTIQQRLPYTPEQVYQLVADIEKYPEFLPWCAAARILRRSGDTVTADLVIKFKAFQEKYTSNVVMHPPEGDVPGHVDVSLLHGPFTHLENKWQFSADPEGCLVDFYIDFRFKSPLLEKMIGFMFDKAFLKMVEAFSERAEDLYGKTRVE